MNESMTEFLHRMETEGFHDQLTVRKRHLAWLWRRMRDYWGDRVNTDLRERLFADVR